MTYLTVEDGVFKELKPKEYYKSIDEIQSDVEQILGSPLYANNQEKLVDYFSQVLILAQNQAYGEGYTAMQKID